MVKDFFSEHLFNRSAHAAGPGIFDRCVGWAHACEGGYLFDYVGRDDNHTRANRLGGLVRSVEVVLAA